MKKIFFIFIFLSYSFSQELVLEKKDPNKNNPYIFKPYSNNLDIFQTIGVRHYTGFNKNIYKDYKIVAKDLPAGVEDEYLLQTDAFYKIQILYKYFYTSIELGYLNHQHNFYSKTAVIDKLSKSSNTFNSNFEMGARIMFLSFIVGYNFNNNAPLFDSENQNYQYGYHFNNPYFKFLSNYKWGPLPVWGIFNYSVGFYTQDIKKTIHSLSFGIRWAITYYIDMLVSYDPLFSEHFSNNLNLQFNFQIVKDFSFTFAFKNSTYSGELPISNQFFIGANYFLRVKL